MFRNIKHTHKFFKLIFLSAASFVVALFFSREGGFKEGDGFIVLKNITPQAHADVPEPPPPGDGGWGGGGDSGGGGGNSSGGGGGGGGGGGDGCGC